MHRWSTPSMSNASRRFWALGSGLRASVLIGILGLSSSLPSLTWAAAAAEREPMTMRVVAVNPSAEKSQTVPVRIDLPQEVKPSDVLDHGDLKLEYDSEKSLYYVFKPDVSLAPKQTRVFEIVVRDVWFIQEPQLHGLKMHTEIVMKRLAESEYRDAAKELGASILSRLAEIETTQNDETIGRKQRIGDYRRNLQTLEAVKEDLARLEKLLSFTGGPPVPEMLEDSPLRSDAPSTTTTWLVIFLVVIFMGLLAGQFFFTWQRRIKSTAEQDQERESAFPKSSEVHDNAQR